MNPIDRYRLEVNVTTGTISEYSEPEGFWCKYFEVALLEQRVKELEPELEECIKDSQKWAGRLAESENETTELEAERDRLKAENEQLEKDNAEHLRQNYELVGKFQQKEQALEQRLATAEKLMKKFSYGLQDNHRSCDCEECTEQRLELDTAYREWKEQK